MSLPRNCPKLLIKLLHQRDQVFPIEQSSMTIGRGEEADLVLPNASVSRIHARLQSVNGSWTISDEGSQNGFRINQEAAKQSLLSNGDEIQIGIFTLVFLGDKLEDNYYRGRSIVYLPLYDPKVFAGNNENTYVMSKRDKNLLARKTGLIHNGCIVAESESYFYPEENVLSFGRKGAVVQVTGFLVMGVVAEITWNDKEHVLSKKGWLTSVLLNGRNITTEALRLGDVIQIASSTFTYVERKGQ